MKNNGDKKIAEQKRAQPEPPSDPYRLVDIPGPHQGTERGQYLITNTLPFVQRLITEILKRIKQEAVALDTCDLPLPQQLSNIAYRFNYQDGSIDVRLPSFDVPPHYNFIVSYSSEDRLADSRYRHPMSYCVIGGLRYSPKSRPKIN